MISSVTKQQVNCCWELNKASSAITTSHQKKTQSVTILLSFFVCRQMQHHSFCVLSLIISFKFHPLISLLHLQSIYILWVEHRSAISSNSTVTSFIILPELLKPALQWGNTESRAASSHSRALKSGFPFLSQSGNYPVLKSSTLWSEGSYLLNTYISLL